MPNNQNGQARLYIQRNPEHAEVDELLDLETAWQAEGYVVFKCYMDDGRTVQFSVAKDELFEELGRLPA